MACIWRGHSVDKKQTWNIGYWVFAVAVLLLLQNLWQTANQSEIVPYSEFEKALAEGRIAEVTVSEQTVIGRLKAANGQKLQLVAAFNHRHYSHHIVPS